jgi:class 3 adenylate cyclase/tetratricopeptide (TPR) repeat protein
MTDEQPEILIRQIESEAERAISIGEPIVAFDILSTLEKDVYSSKCWQLLGQALANCGSPYSARTILEKQYQDDPKPALCASLARVYKDLWKVARNTEESLEYLSRSHELYAESSEKYVRAGDDHESYYTSINAASTAVFMDRRNEAVNYAEMARDLCLKLLESPSPESKHWIEATLGEAMIILGDLEQAKVHYRRAQKTKSCKGSHIGTMRAQARLALEFCGFGPNTLDADFRVPKVCVFSGHMLDRAERETPQFQLADIKRVQSEIRYFFDSTLVGVAYSSAACGSDILFLEEALSRGIESIIVLPFSPEDFKKSSVSFAGRDWEMRFDKALNSASHVINLDDDPAAPGSIAFTYTNRYLDGVAHLRARALETETCCLAVWNRSGKRKGGGTSEIASHWEAKGADLSVIEVGIPSTFVENTPIEKPSRTLASVVFADVVGFSKLLEPQIAPYVENFLGGVRELSNRYQEEMKFVNTWGDAIFAVFDSVEKVGEFALDLRSFVRDTHWEDKALPESLSIRIALHAAPASALFDPVLGKTNYFGQHISQAARIEPITPPGEVYASESFAALAANEGVDTFVCEYVGRVPLAKAFGTFPLFHVKRRNLNAQLDGGGLRPARSSN